MNALLQFRAELFVGLRAAGESDNGERRRKLSFVGEIVQRRDELAMREVARRAENHQHARLWCPSADEPLTQGVLRQLGFVHDQ